MSKACSICQHPDQATIDMELAKGASAPVLALRFGVSKDAILRHRQAGHIGREPRPTRRGRYGETADSVIDDLVALKEILDTKLELVGDDHKAFAAVAREARMTSETVARLRGFDKQSHDNCVPRGEYEQMVEKFSTLLSQYPEVKKAVLAQLDIEGGEQ